MSLASLTSALAAIRQLVIDCDGVLTSGHKYYSEDGEELLRFHARDGYGIRQLVAAGISVQIVTRSTSRIIDRRASDLESIPVMSGIISKAQAIRTIANDTALQREQIAFMGDDEYDLEVLPLVSVFACPADATSTVLNSADVILSEKGGDGAVREMADLIALSRVVPESPWSHVLDARTKLTISVNSHIKRQASALRDAIHIRNGMIARGLNCELEGDDNDYQEVQRLTITSKLDGGVVFKLSGQREQSSQRLDTASVHSATLDETVSDNYDVLTENQRFDKIDDLVEFAYLLVIRSVGNDQRSLKFRQRSGVNFSKTTPSSVARGELVWHRAIRKGEISRSLIPPLISTNNYKLITSYSTSLVAGFSLRDVLYEPRLRGIAGSSNLKDAMHDFLETARTDFYHVLDNAAVDEQSLAEYYDQKLTYRTRLILSKAKKSHTELIRYAADLGAKVPASITDPREVISEFKSMGRWPEVLVPPRVTFIHGDPHFGNLIFGTRSKASKPQIYLIDGKDQRFPGVPPGAGDPAYDFGKLLQSVNARTDRFLLNQEYNRSVISNLLSTAHGSEEDKIFESLALTIDNHLGGYSTALNDIMLRTRARILMAFHLITMSPAIPHLSSDIAAVFYAQGLAYLEDVAADFDSRKRN